MVACRRQSVAEGDGEMERAAKGDGEMKKAAETLQFIGTPDAARQM